MINPYISSYGLNFCCRVIGIKKSSWYHHARRTLTTRDQEKTEQVLKETVIEIITAHPGYGYRRIKPELKKRGIVVNHKRLLPLLRKWGVTLKRRITRKTQSGIDRILWFLGTRVLAVKRLSQEAFGQVGKVVYTDFTEIIYAGGTKKLYLIPYLEHVSKVVTGYAVGRNATTILALEAFDAAVTTLRSWSVDVETTYFHQDQGTQFKSYEYVAAIVMRMKAFISYSRIGTPGDNPEMESFFGRLKDEWKAVFLEADTEEEIIRLIDRAISYYNTTRIHSAHKDKSPMQFLKETLKQKNF